MKKISEMSNSEFVNYLMEFGSPMNQLVIICAIQNYLNSVEGLDPKEFENGFLDGTAWATTCDNLRKLVNEKYK